MTKTDELNKKFALKMQRDNFRRICRDHQITFNGCSNLIDARLKVIASGFVQNERLGGMSGAMQTFGNFLDSNWYKVQAARKLLALRNLRRWYSIENGNAYTSRQLLADAAHCRRRAAGISPMPNMLVIG